MSEMEKGNATFSIQMHLAFSAEEIWPLLCPVREYDWIEVWACDLVHSESGYNELGCVFQTEFPTEGDRETWVTSRFEPMERIEFVRINSWRGIRFVITLEPDDAGTVLTWTHHVTPLSDAGVEYVKNKPEVFDTQMGMLATMLGHYLETGQMIKGEDLGLVNRIANNVHSGKTS